MNIGLIKFFLSIGVTTVFIILSLIGGVLAVIISVPLDKDVKMIFLIGSLISAVVIFEIIAFIIVGNYF